MKRLGRQVSISTAGTCLALAARNAAEKAHGQALSTSLQVNVHLQTDPTFPDTNIEVEESPKGRWKDHGVKTFSNAGRNSSPTSGEQGSSLLA